MPRLSNRQRDLRFVRRKLEMNIALASSSDSDSSLDSGFSSDSCFKLSDANTDSTLDSSESSDNGGDPWELEDNPGPLFELYFVMDATRYHVERPMTRKSKDFAREHFAHLPDRMFRQLTRMEKRSFFHLVALIEPHPVFYNNSRRYQASVELQLAVTLDRLGHDGNGACLNHMIPTWGVSNGSLVLFTQRCFKALECVLNRDIIWPDSGERDKLSDEFARLGFPGCVGLIDGSLLPLSQRPHEHGECYYDRKSKYSLNAQVVCDHRRKILLLFTGMPGSCQDLTCLRRSPMWPFITSIGPNSFFSEGQYLLGDSGYMNLPHLVSAFKKSDTDLNKEQFNTCIAKCRVINEHCIGILKSRWHSLKNLRVQLNFKKDSVWLMRWISLCAKLHNYVMSMNDEWTEEDDSIELEPQPEAPGSTVPISRAGQVAAGAALMQSVMAHALAFNRQPGGFLSDMPSRMP